MIIAPKWNRSTRRHNRTPPGLINGIPALQGAATDRDSPFVRRMAYIYAVSVFLSAFFVHEREGVTFHGAADDPADERSGDSACRTCRKAERAAGERAFARAENGA